MSGEKQLVPRITGQKVAIPSKLVESQPPNACLELGTATGREKMKCDKGAVRPKEIGIRYYEMIRERMRESSQESMHVR